MNLLASIHNTCQWIGNSPTLKPICNNHTVKDKAYCEEHLWLVYQKGTAKPRPKSKPKLVWNVEDEFNQAVIELENEGAI